MSLVDALKNAQFVGGSKRLRGIANSLRWRSAYCNDDFYDVSLNRGETLRLTQIQNGEITGLGTGANVWPAAMVLAKYLMKFMESSQNPEMFNQVSCCELGAGTGITGLVAAYLGCNNVTVTDQSQLVPLMEMNIESYRSKFGNDSRGNLRAMSFDWLSSAESQGLQPSYDLLLISECIVPKLFPMEPLMEAIGQTLAIDGIALLSYEHRHHHEFDPRDKLHDLCEQRNLCVIEIPKSRQDEVYQADDIFLYQITWKSRTSNGKCPLFIDLTPPISDFKILTWNDAQFSVEVNDNHSAVCIQQEESKGALIGQRIWPSSIALSKYLIRNKGFVNSMMMNNDCCLELGSGVGLTSVVLSTFVQNLICSDKLSILPLLSRNLNSNNCRQVEVLEFEWTNLNLASSLAAERHVSLIVGSDLLYDTQSVELLLNLFCKFPISCKILLSNEIRSSFDIFLTDMVRMGYCVRELGIDEVYDKKRHVIPVRLVLCEIDAKFK